MSRQATHEEWVVLVQQRCGKADGRWYNAKRWYPGTQPGDRCCKSEAEARAVLAHAYRQWNGKKIYNADGKRYNTHDAGGGFGVTLVSDKKLDHDLEIIAHKIRKRIVTEWEDIEES